MQEASASGRILRRLARMADSVASLPKLPEPKIPKEQILRRDELLFICSLQRGSLLRRLALSAMHRSQVASKPGLFPNANRQRSSRAQRSRHIAVSQSREFGFSGLVGSPI